MRSDVHKTFALNIADRGQININCKCSISRAARQNKRQAKINWIYYGRGLSGSNLDENWICRWLSLALSSNSHRDGGIYFINNQTWCSCGWFFMHSRKFKLRNNNEAHSSPGGVENSANSQDKIQIAIRLLFCSIAFLFLCIFLLVINSCSIFNELNVFALTGSGGCGSGMECGL